MLNNAKSVLRTTLNKITQAIRGGAQTATPANGSADSGTNQGGALAGAAVFSTVGLTRIKPSYIIGFAALGMIAFTLFKNPPIQVIEQGEIGIRSNVLTGGVTQIEHGTALILPGIHALRHFNIREQSYRADQMAKADGPAPLQSVEGLSVGIDLSVRYALDASKLALNANAFAIDLNVDLVEPALQGIVYKTFAKYTVREIFSTKRVEIQQVIEAELKTKLAAQGVLLRAVQIGKIDLPADYRKGMDSLLAEGLATEKMRYTLELKDKRIKETELDAEADKVRREKSAEAAGREQIIAAKAQEEAMKHVLPFKQRQIEQRTLEAEAEKVSAIRRAEGSAQARRVEASGEADSRQKLADAEVYRLDKVGKSNSEQMAREGVLISKHPLLINKAMADKLSDKIQVIIAPPSTNGDFIGATLVGSLKTASSVSSVNTNEAREVKAEGSE